MLLGAKTTVVFVMWVSLYKKTSKAFHTGTQQRPDGNDSEPLQTWITFGQADGTH